MDTVRSVQGVRHRIAEWLRTGDTIGFVPTMGNLHRGHISLVDIARDRADHVVCSIYVNPTQFGPDEDYARYPRTLEADLTALGERGVDIAFVPGDEDIYPLGKEQSTWVEVPGLGNTLCGASRPGHFRGVTSVVCRLLNIVQPHYAVFGEKDYQQLAIIRRMVADLSIPAEIVGAGICREDDGLALSSRNQYLSPEERGRAPLLRRQLGAVTAAIASGERDYAALEERAVKALDAEGFRTDYVAVRDPVTLEAPAGSAEALIVLGAAWLGRTRLIDNVRAQE